MAFSLLVVCVVVFSFVSAERIYTLYPHNVGCSSLGAYTEYKIEYPPAGLKFDVPDQGGLSLGDFNSSSFRGWSADFPVQAIILKGAHSSAVYSYAPDTKEDLLYLHTPWDSDTRCFTDIIHIGVCHKSSVQICNTVTASYDIVFAWNITKEALQTEIIVPASNDPLETVYDYRLKATPTEKNWTLVGSVLLRNPSMQEPIEIFVTATYGPSVPLSLFCPDPATGLIPIGPGSSITCDYRMDFGDTEPNTHQSVHIVVTVPADSRVRGATDFQKPVWVPNLVDECIDLTDSIVGALGTKCFDWDEFICDSFTHTVTISECGYQEFTNQITGVTTDEYVEYQSYFVTVIVEVPCLTVEGCEGFGMNDLSFNWIPAITTSNATVVEIDPNSSGMLIFAYTLSPTYSRVNFNLTVSAFVCNPNILYNVDIDSITFFYGTVTITDAVWYYANTNDEYSFGNLTAGSCIITQFSRIIPEQSNSTLLDVLIDVASGSLVSDTTTQCGPFSWAVNDLLDDCVMVQDVANWLGQDISSTVDTQVCYGIDSLTGTYDTVIDTTGVACGHYPYVDHLLLTGLDDGRQWPSSPVEITIDIPCPVTVIATAHGLYDLLYLWQVEKNVSTPSITLHINVPENVTYYYTLIPTDIPMNWIVRGQVAVGNFDTLTQSVLNFAVLVSYAGNSTYALCDTYSLAPGASTLCNFTLTYASQPASTEALYVTVQADPDFMGANADPIYPVWYLNAAIDKCVGVTDNIDNTSTVFLPSECAPDPVAPITDSFSALVVKCECGNFVVRDQISVAGLNSFNTVLSYPPTELDVVVLCDYGCTYTQGYWKEHSNPSDPHGKYNHAWDPYINEIFFSSGSTYLEIMFIPPAGNDYYSLAHQYVAAILNMEAGASLLSQDATNAMAYCDWFFSHFSPLSWPPSEHANVTAAIQTLTDWNEGKIGPGSCEDNTDTQKHLK